MYIYIIFIIYIFIFNVNEYVSSMHSFSVNIINPRILKQLEKNYFQATKNLKTRHLLAYLKPVVTPLKYGSI